MRSTLDMLHDLRDIDDPRLTSTHRLVLAMLLAHRELDSEKPRTYGATAPSAAQLGRSTMLGESTLHRVRSQLRGWGYLTVRHGGHHHAAPVFDINLPERSRRETSRNETSRTESQGSRKESEGVSLRESGVSQRDLLRISSGDLSEDPSAEVRTAARKAKKAKALGRGSRLSADWEPSPKTLMRFRTKELVDAAACVERFKNHWLTSTGRNAVKLDWERAFVNWVLEDIARGRVSAIEAAEAEGPKTVYGPPAEPPPGLLERMRAFASRDDERRLDFRGAGMPKEATNGR